MTVKSMPSRFAPVEVLRTPPISIDRESITLEVPDGPQSARRQRREIEEVAGVERQLEHGAVVDHGPQRGGVGLQLRSRAARPPPSR